MTLRVKNRNFTLWEYGEYRAILAASDVVLEIKAGSEGSQIISHGIVKTNGPKGTQSKAEIFIMKRLKCW